MLRSRWAGRNTRSCAFLWVVSVNVFPCRTSTRCQGLPARPTSSITNRYPVHSSIVLLHQYRRHSHPHQISNRKTRVPGSSHLITIDLTISMLCNHIIPLYDSLTPRLSPV